MKLAIYFGSALIIALSGAVFYLSSHQESFLGTSLFITAQGGTGTSSPSGILYGDNGATSHLNTVVIGTNLTFSGGTLSASGGSPGGSAGQLQYNASGSFGGVATTSVSCSGSTSCTSFTAIGASPITITSTSGSGNVSTSTNETAGTLAYWTSTSATPALLGKVSTTSLTATSPLSLSQPISVIGSSASALSIATTTTSLFSGSLGQVLAYTGNGWMGVATTTFSTGLTYTNGAVTVNTSQNIATLSNLTTNGLVTTSGSNGTLGVTANSTNGFVLAMSGGIPTWVATSSINNGVTSIAQTYGTAQTGAIILATSTATSFNGLTFANAITNSSGTFTFAPPTVTGTLTVAGGGTGQTSFTSSNLLYGAGTVGIQSVATTSATCSGTISCTAHTVIGSSPVTFTSTAGAFPFTIDSNYGSTANSTTTPIWFKGSPYSLFASSTAQFNSASTTNFTNSGNTWLTGLSAGTININASNLLYSTATSSVSAGTGVTFSGTAGALIGGTALTINTPWTISANDIYNNNVGVVGIGTTTPKFALTIASSTGPQLTLTDGLSSTNGPFNLRAINTTLFLSTSSPTTWATTTTPILSVDSSGKAGISIGSTSPTATISVSGSPGDFSNLFAIGSSSQNVIRIDNSGHLFAPLLTQSAANQTYYACGIANTFEMVWDTTTCLVSAAKFKKDVQTLTIDDAFKVVMTLKPKTYVKKDPLNATDALRQPGFIADDAVSIAPLLVSYDAQGEVHGFRYEQYTAYLTGALQYLEQQIESLLARVTGIEKRLDDQQKQIDSLRAEIDAMHHEP